MQAMRDLLRTTMARSLAGLSPLDRLAAAWPIAAGHAIAERSAVTSLHDSTATVTVADAAWQAQLRVNGERLQADVARISRVPLTAILFVLPSAEQTETQPGPPAARNPRRKP